MTKNKLSTERKREGRKLVVMTKARIAVALLHCDASSTASSPNVRVLAAKWNCTPDAIILAIRRARRPR